MITDMTIPFLKVDGNRGGHSWLKLILRASFEPHHGRFTRQLAPRSEANPQAAGS
jgi:hypothetical protein